MLELFDRFLVSQHHLFKRSVLLVKAWCCYESRTLGSRNGLLATYALEVLMMALFATMDFRNQPISALSVLRRFLLFYANFEWDRYAVTVRGSFNA